MARGNSRAQSELVDRLKAKIANKQNEEALKKRAEDQKRAQEKAAYAAIREARDGEPYRPDRSYYDVREARQKFSELFKSGPLSVMKDSALVKALTAPKVASVSDEKAREVAELAKPTSLDDYLGDNFSEQLVEGETDEEGYTPDLQDSDGNPFSYDETSFYQKLPDYFVESGGKVYQVQQGLNIPIEIDDDNNLVSTAKSADDIERDFTVKEVIVRPGEYVKDGRLITTYGDKREYGAYRSQADEIAERQTPEFKRARREFESLETQVKQFNSILKKNPKLNQDARLVFSDKIYSQGTLGESSYRFRN